MTDKLRATLRALVEAHDRKGDNVPTPFEWRKLFNEARAALSEPVADEPPYGWHLPSTAPHWNSPVFVVGAESPPPLTREGALSLGWIPVYTRPAPAPADRAQRVPLTEAEIADACMWYRHDFGLLSEDERKACMWEAREWEKALNKARAHGIGAKP